MKLAAQGAPEATGKPWWTPAACQQQDEHPVSVVLALGERAGGPHAALGASLPGR